MLFCIKKLNILSRQLKNESCESPHLCVTYITYWRLRRYSLVDIPTKSFDLSNYGEANKKGY